MVRPFRRWNTPVLGASASACLLLAGCAVVPKAQLDECHQMSRTLQSDNDRLKSTVLTQSSQIEDLTQRAVDDGRRLAVQDKEIRRLVASITSYQDDRDRLDEAYQQLKRDVQIATNPVSAALLDQFDAFAKGHPQCEFDRARGVFTVSSDALFKPSTDQLKPEAAAWIQGFADLLKAPELRNGRVLVTGHTDQSPVSRTGMQAEASHTGHLSLDRASRVREALAADAGIDASRIEVAGFESSQPRETGPDDAARARNRRIEIHLLPGAQPPKAATLDLGSGRLR